MLDKTKCLKRIEYVKQLLASVVTNKTSITEEEIVRGKADGFVRKTKKHIADAVLNGWISDRQVSEFRSLYQQAVDTGVYTKLLKNSGTKGVKNLAANSLNTIIGTAPISGSTETTATTITSLFKKNPTVILTSTPVNGPTDFLGNLVATASAKVDAVTERNTDDEFEGRTKTWVERDENCINILRYHYEIHVKNEPVLAGSLTREEMEKIYHQYPYATSASVSTEFPNLTFIDFKRILKAFNITKDRRFPQHILEEQTPQKAAELALKAKEHAASKAMIDGRVKYLEDQLRNEREKNKRFDRTESWIENLVKKLGSNVGGIKPVGQYSNKPKGPSVYVPKAPVNEIFALFGDIHFGKNYIDKKMKFGRGTSKTILHERMLKVGRTTVAEARLANANTVHLCCLGDLFETVVPEGMHASQQYFLDLKGDEQITFAINSFIAAIDLIMASQGIQKLYLRGLGGNHDRISKNRDDDRYRTAASIFYTWLGMVMQMRYQGRVEVIHYKDGVMSFAADSLSFIMFHGDSNLVKKDPEALINMFKEGATSNYTLVAHGHYHSFRTKPSNEGANYNMLQVGSLCSGDDYSINQLGVASLPSMLIVQKAEHFGIDFKKVTLY